MFDGILDGDMGWGKQIGMGEWEEEKVLEGGGGDWCDFEEVLDNIFM